jgi:hypothetical protein
MSPPTWVILEMEEPEPVAGRPYGAVFLNCDRPAAQIPTCDVTARISQNVDAIEEDWHMVAPALIGEQAVGYVVEAEHVQAVPPPLRETSTFRGTRHGEEPQVVYAMLQRTHLVVHDGRPFQIRLELMGSQNDIPAVEQQRDRRQVIEKRDIWVEVDNFGGAFIQELAQHRPFDRRAQLHHVVIKDPLCPPRNIQLVQPNDMIERLAGRIEVESRGLFICQAKPERPVGMEMTKRLAKHARSVEV